MSDKEFITIQRDDLLVKRDIHGRAIDVSKVSLLSGKKVYLDNFTKIGRTKTSKTILSYGDGEKDGKAVLKTKRESNAPLASFYFTLEPAEDQIKSAIRAAEEEKLGSF